MRYALNNKNRRIEVSYSTEKAICPICRKIVYGKKGEFKIKHWAHLAYNCDEWYEPVTEWHLWWQNKFPEKNREVYLKKDFEIHRADILLENELVIEVQNSPIKPKEIEKRERFYGENNMIWILNGENLAKKSEINFHLDSKLI